MKNLFDQLKVFLKMEDEIPFAEFTEYYKNVIEGLNAGFETMDQDNRIKARYICSILQANADSRALRSKANAKAYKKISAKAVFWMNAINFRLIKDGMTQQEIDKLTEEINDSI